MTIETADTQTKSEAPPERKSRQFWAITDRWQIKQVVGYECPPNEDVWWVPELGYSLSEKHHLFPTAEKARAKAIKELNTDIAVRQKALSKLVR